MAETPMGLGPDARPVIFVLCPDPAALLPFYQGVLGLSLRASDAWGAVLDLGHGATLRLTKIGDHAPGPHTVMGWEVPDFDAVLERLLAAGITPDVFDGFGQDARGVWTAPDGRKRMIWLRDPAGNGLSLSS